MYTLRMYLVLIGSSAILGAQSVPADWQTVKDQPNVCQAAVPTDWKPLAAFPSMFEDPKGTASVMVANEESDNFKQRSPAVIQAFDPEKVVENSNKRVFLIDRPKTLFHETSRGWR